VAGPSSKAAGAFRTIGEVADELNLPQHILRYWETRFPQLRPLQRAGNRRYYRPSDVELVRRIHRLLNQEGYTVRGVRQLLDEDGTPAGSPPPPELSSPPQTADLRGLRDLLAHALYEDQRTA
jgi:DNA-binding transcriptional MerR regulator